MNKDKLQQWIADYLPVIVTVFLAALGGTGAAIVVTDDDPNTPDRTVISVRTQQPKADEVVLPAPGGGTLTADQNQTVQPDEMQAENEKTAGVDIHEDAKDETPPGVSKSELVFGEQQTAILAEDRLVEPQKVGGAGAVNCIDRPVVNQSSLSQRRVGVALHFTVSPFGTINAIHGLFNTPSFAASSNYGFEPISLECQRWVPEGRKAWAQGAANSAYVSIEIVTNDLSRSQWLATPMFKTGRLAQLVREISLRNGTPMKLVDPVGCVWLPGITDHSRLECGNTHWDVGKNFPWDVFMNQVRQGVRQPVLTASETKLVGHARHPKGSGHSQVFWCRQLGAAIDRITPGTEHRRPARRKILQRVRRGVCA